MGNKNSKMEEDGYNNKLIIDIINGDGLIPDNKYEKTLYFYDDFIHFKGIKTSYLILDYRDISSWSINFLTSLVMFHILLEGKKYDVLVQFDEIHKFDSIFTKHIQNKVKDIEKKKKNKEKNNDNSNKIEIKLNDNVIFYNESV